MERFPLRPYQVEGKEWLKERTQGILVWPMRSGKTVVVLSALQDIHESALIVAPPKVVPVWKEHYKAMGCTFPVRIISNHFSALSKPNIRKWKGHCLVVDEIHTVRRNSKRYKNLMNIRSRVARCYGCTGTIIDSDLLETFYIFCLLSNGDLYGKNKSDFDKVLGEPKYPHMRHTPYMMKKHFIPRYLDEIAPYMNVLKMEVIGPEKKILEYSLTQQQKDLVRKVVQEKPIKEIDGKNVTLEAVSKETKISQITSGHYLLDQQVVPLCETLKWGVIQEVCLQHPNKKIILWNRFIFEENVLLYGGMFHGRNVYSYKRNQMSGFTRDPSGILVAHPRSAGTGIDFSMADVMIFVNEFFSQIELSQAEARMNASKDNLALKIIYYARAVDSVVESLYTDKSGERKSILKKAELNRIYNL